MKTLTEVREFLSIAIEDVQYDLSTGWVKEQHKLKMELHLQMLIAAKGNLDAIATSGQDSQIFKSSMNF
jgi:hypothetical protein